MKIQSEDRDVFYIIHCACVTLFIFPLANRWNVREDAIGKIAIKMGT